MFRRLLLLLAVALAPAVLGEELFFDFAQTPAGKVPAGFKIYPSGQGQPGDWRILLEDLPPAMAASGITSRVTSQRAVLAQLSREPLDERFPLIVYEPLVVDDFTFTTRLKVVEGKVEQMAGVAFRVLDPQNYYVARVSCLGNNIRFYKFVGGVRTPPLGPEIEVPKGVWHELSVECKGNQIRVFLNGKQAIPTLTDDSFSEGKVGFWTKSDSVSYFAEARLQFTPRISLAQQLVDHMKTAHARIVAIRIYAPTATNTQPCVIASTEAADLGMASTSVEEDVIARGMPYFGKEVDDALVTLPLRDRNGDPVAAVKFILKRFPGQTDQNAVARALPLIKEMQQRVRTASDLTR